MQYLHPVLHYIELNIENEKSTNENGGEYCNFASLLYNYGDSDNIGAFKIGDIQETQTEQFEKEAIRVALVTTYLPELACTDDNHIVENCFDFEKVKILSELVGSTDDYLLLYQNEFKYSRVKFDIIYPEKMTDIIIYDRPIENFTDLIPTYIPVSIRDPTKPFGQQYHYGMLEVGVYR